MELDEAEMRCLKAISMGSSTVLLPCGVRVLRRLVDLGLVEYEPGRRLPLEMVQLACRLTPAGVSMIG